MHHMKRKKGGSILMPNEDEMSALPYSGEGDPEDQPMVAGSSLILGGQARKSKRQASKKKVVKRRF